ncbi:hypothetical protein GGI02_001140 [Coemansia sp. RSA 2322]|nr:hypothetical protein GGI02_001140 [Coemansia sp. RSA 2322]
MNQSTPKRIESRDIYHRPGQHSTSAEKEKRRPQDKDDSAGSKSKTHFFTNLTSVNIATAFARARITSDTINNRPVHLKGTPMSPSQLPRMNQKDIPDAHNPRAHFESSMAPRPFGSSNANVNSYDAVRPIRDITSRAQVGDSHHYSSQYHRNAPSGYQDMEVDPRPVYDYREPGGMMPDGFLRERDWKPLQNSPPSWFKKTQDKRPKDLLSVSPPPGLMGTPTYALGRSGIGGSGAAAGSAVPPFQPPTENLIDMKTPHPPRDTAAAVASARRLADEALADNDYLIGTAAQRGASRGNENMSRLGAGGQGGDRSGHANGLPPRAAVSGRPFANGGGAAGREAPANTNKKAPVSNVPNRTAAARSTGGGAAAFVNRMRQQQKQQQEQHPQQELQQQSVLDGVSASGPQADDGGYNVAPTIAANGVNEMRPSSRYSARSRISTPARSRYGHGFTSDEDEPDHYQRKPPAGSSNKNGPPVPTPYTARIKGPGAFPATAQRYSQRRPKARSMASDIDDEDEGNMDFISPTMARQPRARPGSSAASLGKGDLLANHRYLRHGNASNRGWDAYANPGDATEHGSVHSLSDSFASNSTAAGHIDGSAGRDSPTLLKRLLRNIATGWAGSAGSFAERVSFIFFMVYFLVKETFVVVGAFVFRLLVNVVVGPVYMGLRETLLLPVSLWRLLTPGSSRDVTRSMTGVLTGFFVVAISVVFSQYGPSALTGLSLAPKSILGGMWSSSARSPPLFTPPTGFDTLTDDEIDKLGGRDSAVVERLITVEKTLKHLYGLLDSLRLYRDEEAQDVRESLRRLQTEKQALLDASRGEKQRVDNLEREYTSIKRDIKIQSTKSAEASHHAKEVENLKKRVDQLVRSGVGKGKGAGPGLDEVRKLIGDAIAKQERELKDMLRPDWLVTDGDAAYANVARMIEDALTRYANDRLGKTDFALSSAGARILPKLTSPTFEPPARGVAQRLWRQLGMVSSNPPDAILDPSTHVGDCWPMLGSTGQVSVHLAQPVDVSDFAIEHVARSVAIDWRSAPRQIEVWGYVFKTSSNGPDIHATSDAHEAAGVASSQAGSSSAAADHTADPVLEQPSVSAIASAKILTPSKAAPNESQLIKNPLYSKSASGHGESELSLLASYEYEPSDSAPLQIIRLANKANAVGIGEAKRVQTLILKVKSNWGHPGHTCIYRFRVHGHRAEPPAAAAAL